MIGLVKVAIAVVIYAVCRVLRWLYEALFKSWYFTSEEDHNFNICVCILLAAWIVKDGIW